MLTFCVSCITAFIEFDLFVSTCLSQLLNGLFSVRNAISNFGVLTDSNMDLESFVLQLEFGQLELLLRLLLRLLLILVSSSGAHFSLAVASTLPRRM